MQLSTSIITAQAVLDHSTSYIQSLYLQGRITQCAKATHQVAVPSPPALLPPALLAGVLAEVLAGVLAGAPSLPPLLPGLPPLPPEVVDVGGGELPLPPAAPPLGDASLPLPPFAPPDAPPLFEALPPPDAAPPPPELPDAPDAPDEGTRLVGVVMMPPEDEAAAAEADALPPGQHIAQHESSLSFLVLPALTAEAFEREPAVHKPQ